MSRSQKLIIIAVMDLHPFYVKYFLTILNWPYKRSSDIENPDDEKNQKKFSSGMIDYIKNHLKLKVNGKLTSLLFTDFKKDDNAYLVNFKINKINAIQRFEVEDNIFYELYDKQIQLVYVTVNGNRKSGRLVNPENKLAFDF